MTDLAQTVDLIWVLVSAGLVLTMQAGFCCLETGLVRTKNSINVAIKNVADFCVASIVFFVFGYALMFGTSFKGLFGTSHLTFLSDASPTLVTFFVFQMMFCGTAITIISGAVAERMRFAGYLVLSLIVSGLFYPLMGHWVWGGSAPGQQANQGWLEVQGFVDFAGGTVVHSVGGWVALAAVIVIGPRLKRFDPPHRIQGQNLPISAFGVLILWVGWIGFNGGSTFQVTEKTPTIIVNTILAGSFGGVMMGLLGWIRLRRPSVECLLNGVLAGLVGITASCHVITPWASATIGISAAVVCFMATRLLERWKIDDAIGAVPVHAAAGAWGTVAVAVFASPDDLGTGLSRVDQFWVQCQGVLVCFAWGFVGGWVVLWLINRIFPLRVSSEKELLGLNMAEHGASSAMLDLLTEMGSHHRKGDFQHAVTVEPHTEAGQIATEYNRVLNRVRKEAQQAQESAGQLRESEARIRAIFQSSPDCLIMMDQVGNILNMNPAAEKTFGAKEEQVGDKETEQDKDDPKTTIVSTDPSLSEISDILDFSKSRVDHRQPDQAELDVRKLVENVTKLFAKKAFAKKLELTCLIHHNVPRFLIGAMSQLQQILMRLLDNAIEFTETGDVVLRATLVSDTPKDARLCFTVTDTGIGVASERQEQLLQPHMVASSSKTQEGKGLTICTQLAKQMGSQIEVQSTVGVGSTFSFTVTLEKAEGGHANTGGLPLGNISVLIVDDNATNRNVLRCQLESWHCNVDEATSGAHAVQKCDKLNGRDPYDLAILDEDMPGMTGTELAKHIGANPTFKDTVLVLLDTFDQSLPNDLRKTVFSACLSKPARESDIYNAVLMAISKRDQRDRAMKTPPSSAQTNRLS